MQASDWERLIGTLGLPLVLLLAIAIAAIKVVRWCRPHVDKIFIAHVALMETCSETLVELKSNSAKTADNVDQLAQHTLDPNGPCQRTVASLKHASHAIESLGDKCPEVSRHAQSMREALGS